MILISLQLKSGAAYDFTSAKDLISKSTAPYREEIKTKPKPFRIPARWNILTGIKMIIK